MIINKNMSNFLKSIQISCETETNANKKGDLLEELVYNICLSNGLRTWWLSKYKTEYSDKPDLHVFWNNFLLYVECKNHKSKIGLPELDSFYSKITRRNPLTIGLYVSYEGFKDEFVNMVRFNSERPIILMDKNDIKNIILMEEDLEELFEFRLLLLQRGIVQFGKRSINMEIPDQIIKKNKYKFFINESMKSFHQESETELADNFTFLTDGILERVFDFNSKLEFTIHSPSITKIRDIFTVYSFIFGFDNESFYSINQFFHQWSGIGMDNFFDECIYNNHKRYLNLTSNEENKHIHHRETVTFVNSDFNHCLIVGFDPGAPYSDKAYKFHCSKFNVKIYFDETYSKTKIDKFRNLINEKNSYDKADSDNYLHIYLQQPINVNPIEYIEEPESSSDDWPDFSGVVFENPFSKDFIDQIIKQNKINEINSDSLTNILDLKYLIGRVHQSYSKNINTFITLSEIKILIESVSGFNQFICEFNLYINPVVDEEDNEEDYEEDD